MGEVLRVGGKPVGEEPERFLTAEEAQKFLKETMRAWTMVEEKFFSGGSERVSEEDAKARERWGELLDKKVGDAIQATAEEMTGGKIDMEEVDRAVREFKARQAKEVGVEEEEPLQRTGTG